MKRMIMISILIIVFMSVIPTANASTLNEETARQLLAIIGCDQVLSMVENKDATKRIVQPETQEDPFEYYYMSGKKQEGLLNDSVSLHYMLTTQNLDHLREYPINIEMLVVEIWQVSNLLYDMEGDTMVNVKSFNKLLEKKGQEPYVNALTYAKANGRLSADALYEWEICPFVLANQARESVDEKLYLYIRVNKNMDNGRIAWYEMILADEEKVGSLVECLIAAKDLGDAKAQELRRLN